MGSALERDLSKFLITVLYAGIVANLLTHGSITVKLAGIGRDVLLSGFSVASGGKVVK